MSTRKTLSALLSLVLLTVALLVVAASGALTQTPTAPPQASIATELIGASVFTGDGHHVGEVAAVTIAGNGGIDELRMSAPSPLGFGERTVVLPPGSYIVLRGAVVLDLSASEVDALPSAREDKPKNRIPR